MAAYSAVVSLVQLLKQALDSDQFSLDYPKPQVESLHGKLSSLQSSLEKISSFVPQKWRCDVKELQIRIRDAIYTVQDTIEYSMLESESKQGSSLSSSSSFGENLADLHREYDKRSVSSDEEDPSKQDQNSVSNIDGVEDEQEPGERNPVSSEANIDGREDGKDKQEPGEENPVSPEDNIDGREDGKDEHEPGEQNPVSPEGNMNGVEEGEDEQEPGEQNPVSSEANIDGRKDGKDEHEPGEQNPVSSEANIDGVEDGKDEQEPGEQNPVSPEGNIDGVEQEKDSSDQKPVSLEEIIADVDVLAEEAEMIAVSIKQYTKTRNLFSESISSSKISSSTVVVGQGDDRKLLTSELMNQDEKLQVLPISGMAGIGKTTLARSIYDDDEIQNHFYIRSWVTVSQDYLVGEIYEKLLNNLESNNQKSTNIVSQGRGRSDERHLSTQLRQRLYETRYLIVIDDMWDDKVWDKIRNSLPDDRKGSRIVVTTRDAAVAVYSKPSGFRHVMRTLNPDESWELLCHKVFGGGDQCPPHLKDVGRKIAESCRGLPLSITVVGGLLSQESRTAEYWSSIREDVNAAAAGGENSYKEILSLSYNHLPCKLKGCFLYMGVFPEDSEILVSKLIKLWVAEGFLIPPSPPQTLEQVAANFLNQLVDRNLVFVREFGSDSRIKTCGLHDTLRDLAAQESRNEKLLYSVRQYFEKLEDGATTQRRVSVHKNALACLSSVDAAVKKIKLARTLLYVGPYHNQLFYGILTFKLLRVLDALTVEILVFWECITKLIHLRYLSLTYSGKLPWKLSKLRNLQILILRRHPKIIFVGESFLPEEIWEMPELRHLVFTEDELPHPPETNSLLFANLQSLSNVNAACCTEEVLGNMPNLLKLGVWSEAPVGFRLEQLTKLEYFRFTVLNPIPVQSKIESFMFPATLKKLSLSGSGLPWEDMQVVMLQLPLLQVLKLRNLAFQGEEWYPEEGARFPELKFLLLEYLDLKYWGADHSHFPSLQRLIIKYCYELEEMEPEIGNIGGIQLIEMVDCSPQAVRWARQVKEEQKTNKDLQLRIYSSWE